MKGKILAFAERITIISAVVLGGLTIAGLTTGVQAATPSGPTATATQKVIINVTDSSAKPNPVVPGGPTESNDQGSGSTAAMPAVPNTSWLMQNLTKNGTLTIVLGGLSVAIIGVAIYRLKRSRQMTFYKTVPRARRGLVMMLALGIVTLGVAGMGAVQTFAATPAPGISLNPATDTLTINIDKSKTTRGDTKADFLLNSSAKSGYKLAVRQTKNDSKQIQLFTASDQSGAHSGQTGLGAKTNFSDAFATVHDAKTATNGEETHGYLIGAEIQESVTVGQYNAEIEWLGTADAKPVLTAVTPGWSAITGGKTITLTGQNFNDDMTATVGDAACTELTVKSETEATCVTPAHDAGKYAVKVNNGFGTATQADAVDYITEEFKFQVEIRSATPTYVLNAKNNFVDYDNDHGTDTVVPYNWQIDWGDGTTSNFVGLVNSDQPSAAIEHIYMVSSDTIETITIRPSAEPTQGWLSALTFQGKTFKQLMTPFSPLSREARPYEFSYMFSSAQYENSILGSLFSYLDTSNQTDFSSMFKQMFLFSVGSPTATIPAGLFSSLDTSQGTDFSSMFYGTFLFFGGSSSTATIPAGLFSAIDTSQGTNFINMFQFAFYNYASSSTVATIPPGLFDAINTGRGTDFYRMFYCTFGDYAYYSSSATIPAGLFSNIDTGQGTSLTEMFGATFLEYANANRLNDGTPDSDINTIWTDGTKSANLTGITAGNDVLRETFYNMQSLTGTAQTFIDTYLGGISPKYDQNTFAGTGVSDLDSLAENWK
jgi:hypothetical protein